jgi:hypothetical protein
MVFVVGCQRTGTTLIGNLLGAHPNAFLIDEPDGLYPWIEAFFEGNDADQAASLFTDCCREARKKYVEPDSRCDAAGVMSPDVTHLVLKAPNLTYVASRIATRFPGAKCVFSYRDVRDVVVSMGKLGWIPMVENQLRRIRSHPEVVDRFRESVNALENPLTGLHVARAHVAVVKTELRDTFHRPGLDTLEVAYENLVQEPEGWRKRLLAHVQLPFDPAQADHTRVLGGWGPGLTHRKSKVRTSSIGRWKQQLSETEEKAIWAVAGPMMLRLEYERNPDYSMLGSRWRSLESKSKFQPVVAIGRGGSGTRLLSELLQSLGVFLGNDINVSGDSLEWVGTIYKLALDRTRGRGSQPSKHGSRGLQDTAAQVLSDGDWSGEQPWGWKLPETILVLPDILEAFPGAKFIHLVRHPIDSALRRTHMTSRLNNRVGKAVLEAAYEAIGWDRDRVRTDPDYLRNAVTWRYQVENAMKFGRDGPGAGQYLEIRFEDLCEDPGRSGQAIADFLGIPFAKNGVSIDVDRRRVKHCRPPDPRADEVWKLCGDIAASLGYEWENERVGDGQIS